MAQGLEPPAAMSLKHPVAIAALSIILGTVGLIGAAVLGLDEGKIVEKMTEPDFARGVIAYLFAVTTVGTAAVLALSALIGISKERFDSGKEVLALLLGVFGTILGFYFGTTGTAAGGVGLEVANPLVSDSVAVAGESITVTAFVSGGNPPYRYSLVPSDGAAPRPVRPDGWIVEEFVPDGSAEDDILSFVLSVTDLQDETVVQRFSIAFRE